MKITNDPRVDKEIRSLPRKDSARIIKVIDLFADYGFGLTGEYLLRTGRAPPRAGHEILPSCHDPARSRKLSKVFDQSSWVGLLSVFA